VGWLLAEGGVPRRVKAAYLTDTQIRDLAGVAVQLRASYRRFRPDGGEVA
jgi:S-DNA-T family DNA segregation ATPase FtsK/SpoIIIE